MIRARIGVLTLGLSLGFLGSFALGQEPAGELVQQLEPTATYLNPLTVNQWVSLNAAKGITGKLVALDESGAAEPRSAVEVSLVQAGKTVSRAMSDADGSFQFSNISAGNYNFVAQSEYTFATFGIHVLPSGSGSPTSFEACVSMVSSAVARELMKENWVPTESSPPKFFDKDPLAGSRIVSPSPKVQLQDGDLFGQVSQLGAPISEQDLAGNVAHIFKAGKSVAASPVGRDGKFRIVGLPPGVYDLAVVGEDGNAVIGFEALGPKPLATNAKVNTARFVSVQEVANVINVELADPVTDQQPEDVPLPVEESGFMDAEAGPFFGGGFSSPGGGFGGGGGLGGGGGGLGGGGGGFGGGGIGGLLGIAGLAVGVAAISGEDDFNPLQASLIAP